MEANDGSVLKRKKNNQNKKTEHNMLCSKNTAVEFVLQWQH